MGENMQTNNIPALSSQEVAAITKSLTNWTVSRHGQRILGSQLGTLISRAIYPRAVREFGGLKQLCDAELAHHVRLANSSEAQADVQYEILLRPAKVELESGQTAREIAGADLWRAFANPDLGSRLWVRLPGTILITPLSEELGDGVVALERMTTQDYKTLARQFCERWPEPARVMVEPTIDLEAFYPHWITALRRVARVTGGNPLREWETLRAEFVAKRLHDALATAGVQAAAAAEIVQTARPPLRREPTAAKQVESEHVSEGSSTRKLFRATHSVRAAQLVSEARREDDAETMRRLVHTAVDMMSLAELRDLRISAGVLHDALLRLE